MFGNAREIVRIAGYAIKIDPSWLLIATLVVWSLSSSYFPAVVTGLTRGELVLLSIVAMLGLFACLIAHELAHALTARRFGLGVGGITLFLFGGVAELEAEPADPRSEFWIAAAGPAASFALAALSALLARAIPGEAFGALFGYLALVNLVLAIFNLVPAFPLDGGRILRAGLWRWTGDLWRATRAATRAGEVFALILIGLGLLSLFTAGPSIGGLWQILIGLFLLTAARGTMQRAEIRAALDDKPVAAFMSRPPATVDPDMTLRDFVDDLLLPKRLTFAPVVEDGQLIGYVDTRLLQAIDRDNWPTTRVSDVYVPLATAPVVAPDLPARHLLDRMGETGRRKYLVARGDALLGVVTLSDLLGYIRLLGEVGRADPPRRSQRRRA